MKKKIRKKLNLRKNTIAKLEPQDKIKIKGGTMQITCYCQTEHKSCSLKINCCPPPENLDNATFYNC